MQNHNLLKLDTTCTSFFPFLVSSFHFVPALMMATAKVSEASRS